MKRKKGRKKFTVKRLHILLYNKKKEKKLKLILKRGDWQLQIEKLQIARAMTNGAAGMEPLWKLVFAHFPTLSTVDTFKTPTSHSYKKTRNIILGDILYETTITVQFLVHFPFLVGDTQWNYSNLSSLLWILCFEGWINSLAVVVVYCSYSSVVQLYVAIPWTAAWAHAASGIYFLLYDCLIRNSVILLSYLWFISMEYLSESSRFRINRAVPQSFVFWFSWKLLVERCDVTIKTTQLSGLQYSPLILSRTFCVSVSFSLCWNDKPSSFKSYSSWWFSTYRPTWKGRLPTLVFSLENSMDCYSPWVEEWATAVSILSIHI